FHPPPRKGRIRTRGLCSPVSLHRRALAGSSPLWPGARRSASLTAPRECLSRPADANTTLGIASFSRGCVFLVIRLVVALLLAAIAAVLPLAPAAALEG